MTKIRGSQKRRRFIDNLTKKIFKILNEDSRKKYSDQQLLDRLEISKSEEKKIIHSKLNELVVNGEITKVDKRWYQSNSSTNSYLGIIDVTSNGNGYFMSDHFEQDVFVPFNNLGKALKDDTVRAHVYKKKGGNQLEASIIQIVERKKNFFIGIFQKSKNFGFVICESDKMYTDIFISRGNMNQARHGDKVIATIIEWPENSKNPFGKIIQIIGRPGEHDTEIHSILLEHGFPLKFENKVEDDAKKISLDITEKERMKRRDMRAALTFTIDPKDAKDFDDALSFSTLQNGNYEIGIHIADVSHYVLPGSLLDKEAYRRATSVYLVDRVVPMLPEILSNELCSLRPNEEKLTFSAIFQMNDQAEIIDTWFGRTIIESKKRFAYEEVQTILETRKNKVPESVSITGKSYQVDKKTLEAILKLDQLAKNLRLKRLKNGAISFERVALKFHLDEKANPIGVYLKEVNDANKLIEEFMLLANRKVAEFVGIYKNKTSSKPFIYRVHDEPNIEKLIELQGIVHNFGYKIDIQTKASTSESLNKLLKDVHGTPEANMIETLTIRTMSKATYTTRNIGHYGLSFDYYSHFTSPIRRYPDVMTHRLLQHYLDGKDVPPLEDYDQKCAHVSQQEERASKAERQSIKYMQVKYMQGRKNEEFSGVISGVTEWGIYIEIITNKCEGMMRIRDLKNDYYVFDKKKHAVIGQHTGYMYQLGDPVMVKVKHTDLERKHLDFIIIEKEIIYN